MEQTSQFPHVWGKIDYIFQPSIIDNTRIKEEFTNSGTDQIKKAAELRDGLAGVIDKVQTDVGLKKVHILEAKPDERARFADALRSNEDWLAGFGEVIKLYGIDNDPRELLIHMARPWWNALQVNVSKDSYDKNTGFYSFRGPVSHSFLAQLKPAGIKTLEAVSSQIQEAYQPISVGTVVHTSDKKIVLGYRSGQNFADTIHLMPVGSAEPHLEGGSVFGSFAKESLEELNFSPDNYQSAELVAKTLEQMPAKGGWHYLIFRTTTQMTSKQVLKHWKTAVDRKEHKKLVVFSDSPSEILYEMRERLWDVTKADTTNLANTTEENHGRFLPQCVLGILASYSQRYGMEWARQAEEYFEGHFNLTGAYRK
jgi:hypothetical protein